MFISDLQNTKWVEKMYPAFKKAFDYVKFHDLYNTTLDCIKIDGDNLYINNSELICNIKENAKLEMHRRYIDIHILLEGLETQGWKITEKCNITQSYNKEKDVAFSDDKPTTYFDIKPGQFSVFFPEDAHAPNIGEGKIRKLIVKIKI